MAPELGDIRQIEQLAANEVPSKEGAWWIMLQTAESICNSASLRDPVNNAYLPEFWTDAIAGVEAILDSESARPLPYDDLMQMITFCGDQLQSVVENPRHNIVKVDTMLMPYRVKNTGSKTMNWLGRQPGKTIKEKLAGKNKMLTQVNEYSYDIRENQVAMMLYRQMMRRVSDRINFGIKANGYDSVESEQIHQLQRIKKLLRNSPLSDVEPKNHGQANNALLSDKNYSIIWRAYLNMTKYDTHLENNWKIALELYVKAVFLSINAEFLSYKDVCVVESRNTFASLNNLHTSYIVGYQWSIPYVVEVSYCGKSISLDVYDAPLYGTDNCESEMHITLTAKEIEKEENYEGRRGTPLDWTIDVGNKAQITLRADLSGIREINSFLTNRIFSFAQIETEKRDASVKHIMGSVAYDIIAGGDQLGIIDDENPTMPVWGSRYAVAYTNEQGVKTFYPGGNSAVHYNSDDLVIVSDAVNEQNNEGLKAALNEIHNRVILDRDDYFFYLVPDSLEEILQKNLKQCVRSWFSRTFPVWRSVAALTYWLENPDYKFEDNSIFAYIDLVGDTATAGMLTIHSEEVLKAQVCNHFPPFPQVEEGDGITEDAFCRQYVAFYADKYGFDVPEDVKDNLVRSGSIKALMIKDNYANQFVEISGRTSVYQITYDKDLISECMDSWLVGIRNFWKIMHRRFDRKPNHALFLSDILINLLYQLERENDLYSIFDEDEQDNLCLYQSSSDLILKGALVYKERLNKHLPTWTEYLPHLSLEVIKDGNYAQLELIGKDVSFDVMGENNEHAVEERLVLKAGQSEYRFPLKKMDISRKSSKIDAYITDKSFPLDYDLGVKLAVRYRYGFDNSFELILTPEEEKDAPFESIIVDWKEGVKKEKKSLYPVYPELTNYDKTLKDIENVKYRLQSVLNTIERFFVKYSSYNAHKCNLSKLGADLTRPIFTIRNIIVHSEMQEANDFVDWFYYKSRIFVLCAEIARIFRNKNIPDIFFEEFRDEPKYPNLVCSAMQLIYSFGQRTPKQLQEYLLKWYYKMNVPHKDNILLNMLYLNSDNDDIMKIVLAESTDHNKMDACIKEISSLCWFDSKMIYKLKEYPAFVKAILSYIVSELNAKRVEAEKGKVYEDFRMKSQRKRYLRYIEMILAILRLREDPDFDLLIVDSKEANSLAETIRIVDDYLGNPVSKIKLKVNKPQALCNMSDIAFAIDMYLTGDEGVDLIEVVSVDME